MTTAQRFTSALLAALRKHSLPASYARGYSPEEVLDTSAHAGGRDLAFLYEAAGLDPTDPADVQACAALRVAAWGYAASREVLNAHENLPASKQVPVSKSVGQVAEEERAKKDARAAWARLSKQRREDRLAREEAAQRTPEALAAREAQRARMDAHAAALAAGATGEEVSQ